MVKTVEEMREHLEHLKHEIGKWDSDVNTRTNLSIFEMIDGGITTLEWVLGDSDVRVA